MRTSIDIPDPLFRRVKKLAGERGTTLRQVVLEALQSTVAKGQTQRENPMKDCSYGQGGLVQGLSWSDLERLDELTYGDRS